MLTFYLINYSCPTRVFAEKRINENSVQNIISHPARYGVKTLVGGLKAKSRLFRERILESKVIDVGGKFRGLQEAFV